jgi:hypothetical protein
MRRWGLLRYRDHWWFPTPLRLGAALGATLLSIALLDLCLLIQSEPMIVPPAPAPAPLPNLPLPSPPPPQASSLMARSEDPRAPVSEKDLRPSPEFWNDVDPHPKPRTSSVSMQWQLVTVGDMLYMLDEQDRLIWTWSTGGFPIVDQPILDTKGLLHVFALDGVSADIDLATGTQHRWNMMNGAANYRQIVPYGVGGYLVVVDMSGYRERFANEVKDSDAFLDDLWCYQDGQHLWRANVPPGATIRVQGKRIFAVTGRHNEEVVHQIPTVARPRA